MRQRETLDSVAIDELAKEIHREHGGRFSQAVTKARRILFAADSEPDDDDQDDSCGAVEERYLARQRIAR